LVTGYPLALLRIEGAALLAGSVYLYSKFGQSWILFAVLLLAPDVAAAAYLFGKRVGAFVYDAVHIELGPALLAVVGVAGNHPLLWSLALIWLSHLGMDRMAGYGLKYPTAFGDTHLGKIGKAASG
jgi:hypothetical protein